MKLSAATYLMVLAGAGLAGTAALAANVVVPKEKCDAAWHMASPNGDTIANGASVPVVLNFTMVDSNKGRSNRRRRVQQGLLFGSRPGGRGDRKGYEVATTSSMKEGRECAKARSRPSRRKATPFADWACLA